jgi:NADH dehydrogenase
MELSTQLERDLVRMPIPAPLFHPGLLPLNAGTFGMSPVHVQDVARAFAAALTLPEAVGQTYALGGPDCLEWRQIIRIIAKAAGTTKLAVPAPAWAVRVVAGLLERFDFCPITRDQLDMLLEGNCCGPEALREVFEIEPKAFIPENMGYLSSDPEVGSSGSR